MLDIVLIVGLPGSGKTHLAYSILGTNTTLIDDLDTNFARVEWFKANPTPRLIVVDPHLCSVEPEMAERQLIKWFGEYNLTVMSFENDLEACWENVARRDDGRVVSRGYLETSSRTYEASSWPKDIPVYRP